MVAMAQKCRETIEKSQKVVVDLLPALSPKHLLWMCGKVEEHAEDWPLTKVHRWIGFVQGGMIANRIVHLDEAKRMFDIAKNSFGIHDRDRDLVDHLDAETAFEIEIGGQG
jgi:hypothetical protein